MNRPTPISVIGVGFRLPGDADNLEDLENLLNNGRSGFVPVPEDRWNRDAFYNTQQNARCGIATKHGYFLQVPHTKKNVSSIGVRGKKLAWEMK